MTEGGEGHLGCLVNEGRKEEEEEVEGDEEE